MVFEKNSNRGFNLVELIVVVAIIGALSTIAIPRYVKYKTKALRSEANSNVSTIVNGEKAAYANTGSFNIWLQKNGAAANPASEKYIAANKIFGACTAPPCGKYNYLLHVGGNGYWHHHRTDGAVNGLYDAQKTKSTSFDNFTVLAVGDILDDTVKNGDVVYYYSETNETKLVCDDLNPGGGGCAY